MGARHVAVGLVMVAVAVACSSTTAPELVGTWGGTEASLALTAAGGDVQYQCGTSTIDSAWTLSANGVFAATGQYYVGGGPLPPGGRPPHAATYAGEVHGTTFTLTVTVPDLDATLGPYVMVRDGPEVTELCL
jgi:hypothetical protein